MFPVARFATKWQIKMKIEKLLERLTESEKHELRLILNREFNEKKDDLDRINRIKNARLLLWKNGGQQNRKSANGKNKILLIDFIEVFYKWMPSRIFMTLMCDVEDGIVTYLNEITYKGFTSHKGVNEAYWSDFLHIVHHRIKGSKFEVQEEAIKAYFVKQPGAKTYVSSNYVNLCEKMGEKMPDKSNL
jgi:hypothetical protein